MNDTNTSQFRFDKYSTTVAVTLIVCGTTLLWPTPSPYTYEHVTYKSSSGQAKEKVFRVNRLTGHTEEIIDSFRSEKKK